MFVLGLRLTVGLESFLGLLIEFYNFFNVSFILSLSLRLVFFFIINVHVKIIGCVIVSFSTSVNSSGIVTLMGQYMCKCLFIVLALALVLMLV